VHVAVVLDRAHMRVRHFERGAGMTYSCGTGAVASAAAAMRKGAVDSRVDVNVPGGHVCVEWDGEHEAFLTGPTARVFDAVIEDVHALAV
jgi:diaminopimelate epimerase